MNERDKYSIVYQRNRGYGKTNHGSHIAEYVRGLGAESLCDVGCGRGGFCKSLLGYVKYIYGVDIASKPTGSGVWWTDSYADNLLLADKSIDYITSFDMLEHLPPDNIDNVLDEFVRVARVGLIFSICYRASSGTCDGQPLHLTVQPESWWLDKLVKYGNVRKIHTYLLVDLKCN